MKFALLFACCIGLSTALVFDYSAKGNQTAQISPRLINGEEIYISQAPYHVSVQTKAGSHVCGGTIISQDLVLTSAQCAYTINFATHQIRYNTVDHNWGGTVVPISTVYINPEFDRTTLQANIALIRIGGGNLFPYSIYGNVYLRCEGVEREFEELTISGWGWIRDESGQLSTRLRQVTLPYRSPNVCAPYYASIGKIVDRKMFCAGDLDHGGAGICHGDEGGAIGVNQGSTFRISGVASYVTSCGQPKLISLFTRVGSFREWIRKVFGYYPNCSA